MPISLIHSPDADDRFMFWALKTNRLASPEPIVFGEGDTQSLNERAMRQDGDVLAVSAAAYPAVAAYYQPLKMGCSIGDGYGPVVVTQEPRGIDSLKGARIAVPGLQTTAYQVLRALLGEFEPVVVPILPMERTFAVLAEGTVDAALIIHEGRLLYEQYGTHKVCDIGEWWQAETGTPLPLGLNVISRSIPADDRQRWAALFAESCRVGMAEVDAFVTEYLAQTPMDEPTLRRYLAMYANESTLSPSDRDLAGFAALYERLQAMGQISQAPPLDWL